MQNPDKNRPALVRAKMRKIVGRIKDYLLSIDFNRIEPKIRKLFLTLIISYIPLGIVNRYMPSFNVDRLELITRRIVLPFLIGYLPIGILVSLITPDNIMDYRLARAFMDFMAVIPNLKAYGASSQLNSTYFISAVMHAMAILLSFVMTINMLCPVWVNRAVGMMIDKYKERPIKTILMSLSSIFVWAAVSAYFILGTHVSYKEEIMLKSNLGTAIYGGIIIFAAWFGAAASIFFSRIYYIFFRDKHYVQKREEVVEMNRRERPSIVKKEIDMSEISTTIKRAVIISLIILTIILSYINGCWKVVIEIN